MKIKGFEDYLIFPAGKVYSLITKKYLRPLITKGYYQVTLCKSGKYFQKKIARLVAQAFIPNPDNKPEVNHKDGNKLNNDVSNLEWCTRSENQLHAIKIGLWKRSPNAGKPKVPIKVYDYKTGEYISTYSSIKEAAKVYGLFYQNICCVLAGRRKQTGGFTFKIIEYAIK